jgi:hypothetical protein
MDEQTASNYGDRATPVSCSPALLTMCILSQVDKTIGSFKNYD